MASFLKDQHVWIPDEDEVVIPARVVSAFSAGQAGKVMRLDNNKEVSLRGGDTKGLTLMNDQSLRGVEDMVTFKELDVHTILHNLRLRYSEDNIYTNIGRILTAVNPFKRLPIYTPDVMDEYISTGSRNMPPHIFGVGSDAFVAMSDKRESQSCIVSGESGSGKTETTKFFLQFISEKSKRISSSDAGFEYQQKILESNPLMEAFGNAKTVRNDNSSRFGKYIQVFFENSTKSIVGGKINSYLLEKSRLVTQAEGERNYHIFYQFCAASIVNEELRKYQLSDATQYYYLNQSEETAVEVEGMDDKSGFAETLQAMDRVNINEDEKDKILNVLAMILNLGNINFSGGETSVIAEESSDVLALAAKQLGTDVKSLTRALTKIDRSTPSDPELVGNNSVTAACDARDSFAKHIYAMLFDWLIVKINASLQGNTNNTTSISVLDIFGFEFFEVNSFEQLCINYTNERLQGHFNDHIFKLEQAEYAKEGIDVSKIEFEDNENVISAIDAKSGILQICGDAIKQRNSTDDTILQNIKKQADAGGSDPRNALSYPTVQEIKKDKDKERVFIVKHYAGAVGYTIDGFLEKNKDTVPSLFAKLCVKSSDKFVQTLFKNDSKKDKKALGLKFKAQLGDLMSTLESTHPHYVRCVKPNSDKVRDTFDAVMVKEQLEYAGLLEVCRIRKLGYPVRRDFKEFVQRYRPLAKGAADHMAVIKDLKGQKIMTDDGYQVGKNKVFLKDAQATILDEELDTVLTAQIIKIQAVVRGFVARVTYRKWQKARNDLKAAIKKESKAALEQALFGFGILPNGGRSLPEYKQATELMDKIKDREKIQELINKAIAARDINVLEAALHAAAEKKVTGIPEIKAAQALIDTIKKEEACKEELKAALDTEDEGKLKAAIAKAKKLKIEDSTEFREAEVLAKAIEDKKNLRSNLEAAIKKKDASEIRTYMNQMANIGLQNDPLVAQGEAIVKEKAKALAEISRQKKAIVEDLEIAIKERNLEELNALESKVIQLGIKGDVVDKAHKMRQELSAEKSVMAKLSAETGAAIAKGQTRQGLTAEDVKEIEDLVANAKKTLDKDDDHLLQAIDDLERLKQQLAVQDELATALKEYKDLAKKKHDAKDKGEKKKLTDQQLDVLKEANDKAMELGLDTSAAVEIRNKINQIQLDIDERNRVEAAKKREEAAARLKDANEEEQQLEAFKRLQRNTSPKHAQLIREAAATERYHISKFYRIRALEDFVGNVPNESKAEMAQSILISRNKPLTRSITVLDDEQNQTACRINRAILQYCGDLSTTFPATLAQYILVRGLQDPGITDEIYLQFCKHIQGNKKTESLDKAWLLMCMASKTFPPSEDFAPFLLNFLITHKQTPGMIGNYARLCIIQLDATIDLGPTWFKPNLEEIQSYRQRPPILATIHNLDGTSQDYPVTPEMRVSQVLDMVRKNMNIKDSIEHPTWGLYVIAEEQVEVVSHKERLIRFYKAYNPSKLAHLDLFLNHWKGNEEELFEKLVKKYGPEPSEEDNQKKKGVLNLPITAAFEAVKMLGFTSQKTAPPSPEVPWPVPWWVHLGDVFYRMSRQKRVPRFVFKRRLIQKKMETDKWLFLQCVDDVRMGYLPIGDPSMIAEMAAMAMKWKYSDNLPQTDRELVHTGLENYIPMEEMSNSGRTIDDWAEMVMAQFPKVPTSKREIEETYVEICKKLPVYGMNFFYARHAASEKNYVIAVDINGVHVVSPDRTKVTRSFEFEKIQKFGATSEYFWMTIDLQQEKKKKGFFLQKNHGGINVLLYTIQSWEMYDCVYDATHAPLMT